MYYAFAVILLAVTYLAFAPRFAAWLYRPMLFHPEPLADSQSAPVYQGIAGQSIYFQQADGNQLAAWFFLSPEAKFTVLVNHGNRGNISNRANLIQALLKSGLSVFIYDYSGYGKSDGQPDLATVTNDAQAAYDYLVQEKQLLPENIILYGESLGGAISAHLATVRKVRAIIYQSGFSSLRRIVCEKMPVLMIYPELLFPFPPLDAVKNFKNVHVPLLIVHGQQDTVVPFHHAQDVFKAASPPKELICFKSAAHSDFVLAEPKRFALVLKEFLLSLEQRVEMKANL